jgi:hypothetical protein
MKSGEREVGEAETTRSERLKKRSEISPVSSDAATGRSRGGQEGQILFGSFALLRDLFLKG